MKIFNNVTLHNIYSRIIIACLMAHLSFAILFFIFHIPFMIYYNVASALFYFIFTFLVRRKMYRLSLICVHLEVCLFVTFSILHMGWAQGYAFYLIALCALVYFCPFKNMYIPYFFSFFEIILFITLKINTTNQIPIIKSNPSTDLFIYCYNACASFIIILYAAFITKLSSFFANKELQEMNSSLQEIVDHDTLTQLNSRAYMEERLLEINTMNKSTCLVLADIDDFKLINDTYGHPCGDYVLFTLSTIIKTLCPPSTDVGRWGGEEFILILYDLPLNEATSLLENIRNTIQGYTFQYESNIIHITMTFGLSTRAEHSDGAELVRIADTRLYFGKRNGKNSVITPKS